ncbi:hypothetical protein [Stackebrandtia albiflava]|nr:hypothetical protein [Stackebrandtia albiflava]
MIRTTVSIPDDVGAILADLAKKNGTNLAAEIAKATEETVWRRRIADHGEWLRANPEVKTAHEEQMMRLWKLSGEQWR